MEGDSAWFCRPTQSKDGCHDRRREVATVTTDARRALDPGDPQSRGGRVGDPLAANYFPAISYICWLPGPSQPGGAGNLPAPTSTGRR